MTDYTMATGTTGQMMIRDTGYYVEFWITSGNSTTFNHQMPWAYNVNGSYSGILSYNYNANAGYRLLGSWAISTSQTVTFFLFNTGTSGLGGPTTFNQFISRATVPASPSMPVLSNVNSTTVDVTFTDGGNGGSAIDSREIGYGTNATTPTSTSSSDGSDTISGLTPGTLYYFWARTHNALGYSAWSARESTTTLRVPDAPNTPVLSSVTPTSMVVTWTPNGNGGAAITDYEVGYGTDSSAPTTSVSATSPKTLTGLTPGTIYYVWVRAQNSVGWSPLSASANAETVAGARIKVAGVWVVAIPYVKDAGVWKIAVPYVKVSGVWKETI